MTTIHIEAIIRNGIQRKEIYVNDDKEHTSDSEVNDIAFFEGRRVRGRGRYWGPPGDYRPIEEVFEEASRKILPCIFDNAGRRISDT